MNAQQLMEAVSTGSITPEEALAQMAAVEAMPIEAKVTEKGKLSVSVKSVKSWPVTIAKDQWRPILENAEYLLELIEENDSDLLTHADAKALAKAEKKAK